MCHLVGTSKGAAALALYRKRLFSCRPEGERSFFIDNLLVRHLIGTTKGAAVLTLYRKRLFSSCVC